MPCLAGQTAPFDPLGRKNSMLNQSKIKAIVFDWDGVIVDSMPMAALVIQATAASYGVQISVEKILATYFQPKEAFYKSIGIEIKDFNELDKRQAANDNKYLFNSHPTLFSDVLRTLQKLKDRRFILGVGTQRNHDNIQNEVEMRGLQAFFPAENLFGGFQTKEEMLIFLIKKMDVASDELIYVDDLPSGITTARKVGAKSAAISRHESGKARLKAERPDYFLDSLSDLLTIL